MKRSLVPGARRLFWYEHETLHARSAALVKSARAKVGKGVLERKTTPRWARICAALAYRPSRTVRNMLRRAAVILAVDKEKQAALDTIERLDGTHKALYAFLKSIAALPPPPKPTADEVAAKRKAATDKVVRRRAQQARKRLKELMAQLVRTQKLVKKWGVRVRYYERRGL